MFTDLVESTAAGKKANRKPWTVAVAIIVQVFLLGVLILVPLVYTQALPIATLNMMLMAPAPPAAAAPAPAQQPRVTRQSVRPHSNMFMAPPSIPPHVDMSREPVAPPEVPDNATIGVVGGVSEGSPNGIIGGTDVETSPTPPPPAPDQPQQRIRLGGNVQAAKLISQPMPVYPPLARQARIQGNVVLHAIIAKDGRVEQLSVISGHPLLIQSALDAVRQWRYQPTTLNGAPVEVDTTITVTFTMSGN